LLRAARFRATRALRAVAFRFGMVRHFFAQQATFTTGVVHVDREIAAKLGNDHHLPLINIITARLPKW
jgi:hypothetical protein